MEMTAFSAIMPGQFSADSADSADSAAVAAAAAAAAPPPRLRRKRKADPQDANHERLNKRMSLLNLEHLVPVAPPRLPATAASSATTTIATTAAAAAAVAHHAEPMHLDDTKHKVYIYDLDDELSGSSACSSDSEENPPSSPATTTTTTTDGGRLVLLPDLAAHLRAATRLRSIPRPVPLPPPPQPPPADDLLQVVLYQPDGPPSLSVPAEHDGVRRAIVAARERVRERQALAARGGSSSSHGGGAEPPQRRMGHVVSFATPVKVPPPAVQDAGGDMLLDDPVPGQSSASVAAVADAGGVDGELDAEYDPDAMDID